MIGLIVSFALPCLFAYWLAAGISRGWLAVSPAVQISLAVCLGLGFSSVGFFLGLWLEGSASAYIYVETIAFAALAAIAWQRQRRYTLPTSSVTAGKEPAPFALKFALVVTSLAAAAFAYLFSRTTPDGFWDAWYNWNHKARFLFFSPAQWRVILSEAAFALPDYPLLTQTVVARGWRYLGDDAEWWPQLLGFLFLVATAGLFVGVLRVLRGAGQALLGGTVLLGLAPLAGVAMMQCADMPVACYFLAAVALAALYDGVDDAPRGLLALSGLAAGFATWTKNEGLLFVAVVFLSRGLAVWGKPWRLRLLDLGAWLWGLAPPLMLTLYFKWFLAPATHLVAAQGWEVTRTRLLDPHRYLVVFDYLLGQFLADPFVFFVALPVCYVALGRAKRRSRAFWPAFAVFWLMVAGYYLTYVATPYDIAWHVSTSVSRLLAQLWPLGLFAFFLARGSPEELLAARNQSRLRRERSAEPTAGLENATAGAS